MKKHISLVALFAIVLMMSGVACQRQVKPGSSASGGGAGNLERIHFDFDRSDIRNDAKPILQRNADWIKAHSGARVVVEGHCDERGTNEYNMALGDRRARSGRDYLGNLGVDSSVLSVVSYGEERPLDSGHNETAWAANRRAEFVTQ